MAIEKKSLIDTRAAAKKAVLASKAAAPTKPGHTVVAPRANKMRGLRSSAIRGYRKTGLRKV